MPLSQTVPSLPVIGIAEAVRFYTERLGFGSPYSDTSFAVVRRDEAEIHLWAADDDRWQTVEHLERRPISTGAESFLSGTASCRVRTDEVDDLYAEMSRADVLHPRSQGHCEDTDWGTREFHVLDLDGNLVTFFQHRES